MATHIPAIQVLSRQNYEDQHLVSLPNAYPLPPLNSSSIRVKPTVISLTTNNFSYARFGHMLGWWDIHPLPPSIPKEYSDPVNFGRISCWGYGEVIESNVSSIETGTQVFGYLPIADLPVDMEIQISDKATQQFMEVSKHRAHALSIYNRYYFSPPFKTGEERLQAREGQGLDAIFFLFATGYCMNRFLFPWNPAELATASGTPELATASFLTRHKAGGDAKPTINASAVKDQVMEILGEQRYFDEFWEEFGAFKEQGAVKSLRLVWGDGMGDVGRGWERLCKGEVGPDEGLVFALGGKGSEKL